MSFKVNVENMINRLNAEVGHDEDIRVPMWNLQCTRYYDGGRVPEKSDNAELSKVCMLNTELRSKVIPDGKHILATILIIKSTQRH